MDKDNNLENSNREEIRIGELLRTEREKKGISCRRLSEIIKIREQLIDALENEEWEKLPARVFIKGFIRSYTIAIGYDTRKALRLFDRCVPLKGGEDCPQPLIRKTKRGNGIYYIIALMLLIAAAAIFLLKVYVKTDNSPQSVSETSATVAVPAEEPLAARVETPLPPAVEPIADLPEATPEVLPGAQSETMDAANAPLDQPEGNIPPEIVTPQADQVMQNTPSDVITLPENTPSEAITPPENTPDEKTASTENVADTQPVPGKALTATVSERTWVKIIADDTPPKEYIFLPGATHTWTAERGFDVTIGNAAGIEINFNGETIKNIGEIGEVKKLRFPDDFQTKWEE